MTIIRQAIWEKHIGPELQAASVAQKVIGPIAMESALASTVAALPINYRPCLFQFDQQGTPEEATSDLPFVAIGSGQTIADPFLAFLRRIFWQSKLPTLPDGIFAALWILEHAIQISPGGVAGPKDIVVLEKKDKEFKARKLIPEEFQEHLEAISAAEKSLYNFRNMFREESDKKDETGFPKP
jgi:hypothetical protein